ncbi:MAG TPA: hypothetical protein PK052_11130 [Anaerohalosphaeraceae bacterium]|nr:hypothetical protein [Anaerohalosphaeraceae bacterium]HOM76907.1 hypothetical protein [Anaerohalosphaeraceae bacterium]HPC65220.1 hypothetical protein [Anaerohalosphaeraceae bacterium]HPO70787.1 hypothetical protein [Anaerohalosphaeraceae bacterium]HRS72449.1 hypothetical protein [Anaerohalosphaeraceae bacterium]
MPACLQIIGKLLGDQCRPIVTQQRGSVFHRHLLKSGLPAASADAAVMQPKTLAGHACAAGGCAENGVGMQPAAVCSRPRKLPQAGENG